MANSYEEIANLTNRITELEKGIDTIAKNISKIKIDIQDKLSANKQIKSGTSAKVSYDSKGLIIGSDKLKAEDIPEISIDQIKDLRHVLGSKVDNSDFARTIENIRSNMIKHSDTIVNTGTKVSYDRNGMIISSTNLSENDIPNLNINKIIGLEETLSLLQRSKTVNTETKEDTFNVIAGTYPKISFDTKGRVLHGENLTMNDLPRDLLIKINEISDTIITLAARQSIEAINKSLMNKLDKPDKTITSGTYTKVTINSDGIVTDGYKLSASDLPELTVDDIKGLKQSLQQKIDSTQFIDLSNNVSAMMSSINKIPNVRNMKNEIERKADKDELSSIRNQVQQVQKTINTLVDKLPSDTILEQLRDIQSQISTINGRLYSLEQKIKNNG